MKTGLGGPGRQEGGGGMKETAVIALFLGVLAVAGSIGAVPVYTQADLCGTIFAGENCLNDVRTLRAE